MSKKIILGDNHYNNIVKTEESSTRLLVDVGTITKLSIHTFTKKENGSVEKVSVICLTPEEVRELREGLKEG